MNRGMIKRTARIPAGVPQKIKELLGGRLMLAFVAVSIAYYVLLLFANIMAGTDMIFGLVTILVQGFVTAESMILYQRKESRNLKHLSVFCLIGMIVMFLIALFLGITLVTLNMEYSAQTEEILQLWAEADLSAGMPFMIATVVTVFATALSLLFMWKALGMSADMLEHRGGGRDWYLPSAITLGAVALITLTMTVLKPGGWADAVQNVLSLIRHVCLVLLLWQASRMYGQSR